MAQDVLLNDVRKAVVSIFQDEAASQQMSDRFAGVDVSASPLLMGYKGAVVMARGRHSINPFEKLSTFNEGRGLLDSAIVADPRNVELRFLRLTIQVNVPRILNYSDRIEDDRAFIEKNLASVASADFRQRVENFMLKAKEQGKL